MQRHTISASLDINGRPIWTDTTTTDGDYVLHDEALKEIAVLIIDRDTAMSMLEDAEARVLRLQEKLSRWEKLMPGMMEE
jgi:hypothetical protein